MILERIKPNARTGERNEKRRRETVGRVLQAARELLTEVGEEALTLRKLSAKTGLSPNTIYAHFGKQRSDIVGAVVADAVVDIGDVDDSKLGLFEPGLTPWEAAVDQFLSHPEFYRAVTMLRTPERRCKHERRNMIKLGRRAQELLANAVRDGYLKKGTDRAFLGEHFALLFRGCAEGWARHELDEQAFRRHLLHGIYAALYVNATEAGRKRCERFLRTDARAASARSRSKG